MTFIAGKSRFAGFIVSFRIAVIAAVIAVAGTRFAGSFGNFTMTLITDFERTAFDPSAALAFLSFVITAGLVIALGFYTLEAASAKTSGTRFAGIPVTGIVAVGHFILAKSSFAGCGIGGHGFAGTF